MLKAIKPIQAKWINSILLSLILGGIFFYLVLHQISYTEVKQILTSSVKEFCLIAVILYFMAIGLRSIRWHIILSANKSISIVNAGRSLIIGYSVNNILPARLGELYRAHYCKKNFDYTRSEILGCILVERFLDGITIISIFAMGLVLNGYQQINEPIFKTILVISTLIFASILISILSFDKLNKILLVKLPKRIHDKIMNFSSGIRIIKTPNFFKLFLISYGIWILEASAIFFILKFSGIYLNIQQLFIAIGIISLSTILPSPPGFLGTMQYAYYLIATSFGYTASGALIAACANQLFLLGSVTLTGILLLGFENLKRTDAVVVN